VPADVEREVAGAPMRARHRQVAVAQRVRDAHISPAHESVIDDQKRLQRADAGRRFHHTVFAHQCCGARTIDAEHGPVRLFAKVGTRIAATRRFFREVREE
jgi:hypothetical protein